MEIWKITNYSQEYMVSNQGRVKSLKRGKEHIMTPYIGKNGYYVLTFYINRKTKIVYLHRLIAEAFIPNPQSKKCIDHIDGNPRNNDIENLKWATHKENMNNPVSIKRMKTAERPTITQKAKSLLSEHYCYEAHDKPVLCITTGKLYKSAAQAMRETGVGKHIVDCCKGRRNYCGGLQWKYA